MGQLDEKGIFYLRSRGLNRKEAQQILMRAYVNEIVENISDEKIKSELMELILDKLPEGG